MHNPNTSAHTSIHIKIIKRRDNEWKTKTKTAGENNKPRLSNVTKIRQKKPDTHTQQ